MSTNNQEIETKYLVSDLIKIEKRLQALGAVCTTSRQLETNLRLDTPTRSLTRQRKVLRIRKYDDLTLTFKKDKHIQEGVSSRVEIETKINNLEQTQAILAELGFKPYLTYEKYRAVYQLHEAQVMLDEMPFGCFVEVEAASKKIILNLAEQLGLNNQHAIGESYQNLFETIKQSRGLNFTDITFENFLSLTIAPADMQIELAD